MVTIHYDYKCVDTCCDSTDILLFTAIACLKSEYNEEKCLLLNTTIECSFGLLWLNKFYKQPPGVKVGCIFSSLGARNSLAS